MLRSPALLALATTFALAASPMAMAKDSDDDSSSAKPEHHAYYPRYFPGSCHDMGYVDSGVTIPILPAEGRKRPVTAYICWHSFTLVPHQWP